MHLDLAELGVPVTCVAKTGYQHPLQNRVNPCVIWVGLLQSLGLDAQVEMRGEHRTKKALQLGMLDGFGGEVVLDNDPRGTWR
jgi:hypothetical protein